MRPPYRPDIDGLRALSAVAVILFHAHVPGFGGGYVGVDVFFVISGYLITQVLLAAPDMPARQWLGQFYLRRCRRLLPALLLLLVVVTALAMLVLMPAQRVIYGRYLAFTSVLLTNLAAWTGHDAEGWPALIHLWTIAVEEQFYLVYPVLLLAAGRARTGRLVLAVGMLAAASLALSIWASYAAPSANLYLAPPRAWELLLGALLVLLRVQIRPRLLREGLAAASLLVIALAVSHYSSATRYPGLHALPVCLAAAALLATGSGAGSSVARLLSTRPLVFTGRMSYSLYLWHAAILSLFWARHEGAPDAMQTTLLLVAIWIAGMLSWRLIERPVRYGTWLKSDTRFLVVAAALNLALGAAGLLLWKLPATPVR